MKKANFLLLILFFIFLIYSLINIKETNQTTMNTLMTFSKTILPALLPFLILNQLIIKLGIIDMLAYFLQFISYPLFKVSGKGASIIIIGLLNGFPSSAIFTSLMLKDNQIQKIEAQRLVNSIFFPSISFIFAIINSNLNNKLFTFLVVSLYLTGFLFLYLSSFKIKQELPYTTFKQTLNSIKIKLNKFIFIKELKETITYTFNTLTNILGVIIMFSIPCNIIAKLITNKYTYLFQGIIEFSMPSIKVISISIKKETITLMLGIILSFSGLSSIMQASLFINDSNLSSKQFITSRILISIITTFILYLFLSFL